MKKTFGKTMILAAGIALLSAGMFSCASSKQAKEEKTTMIVNGTEIVNSYNNSEELKKNFPIIYPTAVDTKMAKDIENRLLTGFANWNRGFDAWKAWGTILYTDDSIYNVHGARLTLPEYQAAMNVTLKNTNIQMGDFQNIIICDDWAAIRYATENISNGVSTPGGVMEFVKFKDYGKELGCRVEEGWGGTRGASAASGGFTGMSYFQTPEARENQKKIDAEMIAYVIPETDNLEEKYPVKFPTTDKSKNAKKMKAALLKDFDAWNQGFDVWAANADNFYTKDAKINYEYKNGVSVDGYKEAMKKAEEESQMKKLYFDSMLINGDWAAIHFRVVFTDPVTGEKRPSDTMKFYHFVEDGKDLKVDMCWSSGR
ncbi:MAG: nuclear transport factor 2 family protein [Treponema sp.]|nr:nuclear transport factor 2 family protein [Treponema sp.]